MEKVINPARLYLLCGKIGSGKSTLAHQLAERHNALLISEDDWLSTLFAGRQNTLEQYIENSGRLRQVLQSHIENLLGKGVNVVLDFPLNTPTLRAWGKSIAENADREHQLHFPNVPDDVCLQRLKLRNESGSHAFQTTEQQYFLISSYFVPPHEQEGLKVIEYV